jgi:hypothetical protein
MTSDGTRSFLAGVIDPGQSAEIAELIREMDREGKREALRAVVRIQDNAFLDRLILMDIGPDRALAFRLIPLVFMAWADGPPDPRESEAVLRGAGMVGLAATPAGRAVLRNWLSNQPDPALLERWKSEVKRIWNRFTPEEQWQMRQNTLGAVRKVAEAAGGLLGLIRKVSAKEEALLRELEALLE